MMQSMMMMLMMMISVDKKNPSTFDVKLGDDDDDDYIPITKMITCRSFNNCCPKGVELGDDAFLLMMVILQR